MSLIGLLTVTEKQVHLDRLHMRPIRVHLKNNWRVPESLEKVIPVPRSLHPHLRWWLEKSNVLQGQTLHPLKHALQIFTDASKEGWGAHLNEDTARGTLSLPESNLHINYLELKAIFLALNEFQDLCLNNIVLVATDNTTVVAYINKGDEVGPSVCPSAENPDLVCQVVIPALAPTLDKSLKGDMSLCPVRAPPYYLDRTSYLRQNKELVFVSFKKGFDKDISPATISLWIKQTMILCYKLCDQEALTLHQVKAHNVRALAASKAFQSGILLGANSVSLPLEVT